MKIKIKPKKINKKNFNKFGQIIDTSKKKYFRINNGYAKRYDNLGKINTSINRGKMKSFKGTYGFRKDFKKAIITLKEGNTIDSSLEIK